MRLSASLFFGFLMVRPTRCHARLLKLLGCDAWKYGWQHLWHCSAVYCCVRSRVAHAPKVGPLLYIGETNDFSRRSFEHLSRILNPDGSTQQPFFEVLREFKNDRPSVSSFLCEWLFIPFGVAPCSSKDRKAWERELIMDVGSLNPPRVYEVILWKSGHRPVCPAPPLNPTKRPFRRLRKGAACPPQSCNVKLKFRTYSRHDVFGLQVIAAALSGHQIPGCRKAALGAWSLAPSPWAYVVARVDRCEEGWRRKRGLRMLRIIASKRLDLRPPISVVNCSLVWTGSCKARDTLRRSVVALIQLWRQHGLWIPVLRHAKFRCTWARTSTLKDALSNASSLVESLSSGLPPACPCQRLRKNARWPSVTFQGCSHIASSQGLVPWPPHLAKLAEWPATTCLPPSYEDVVASFRDNLRMLKTRCKAKGEFSLLERLVAKGVQSLWPDVSLRAEECPIQWNDVLSARRFVKGLFVSVFDHNTSRLGFFCPRLAWLQARLALGLDPSASSDNFQWSAGWSKEFIIQSMAHVPGATASLSPFTTSCVPRKLWDIGRPVLLPKWKAPGIKWRLIINKRFTPCNRVHSLVCRGIDAVLDSVPVHHWSDFSSPLCFIDSCQLFNERTRAEVADPICATIAGDMCDCFHHIPVEDCVPNWEELSRDTAARGFACVSVPLRSGDGPGKFGKCEYPGWITLTFDDITCALRHFSSTNFLCIGDWIGRETKGVPMGDALSSAALRLFKWVRERRRLSHERSNTISYPGFRHKLVHVCGVNIHVLDVSFRDDLRLFCVWDRYAPLPKCRVLDWGWQRFVERYCVGTMQLEESDVDIFIGIHTLWRQGCIRTRPDLHDPWGAHQYHVTDNSPLKP